MRYLSDKTNKAYDTEAELIKAEKEFDAINVKKEAEKAERARRAKEVDDAFLKVKEDEEKAEKVLNDFIKDYGCYHTTFDNGKHLYTNSISKFLDHFFNNLF